MAVQVPLHIGNANAASHAWHSAHSPQGECFLASIDVATSQYLLSHAEADGRG